MLLRPSSSTGIWAWRRGHGLTKELYERGFLFWFKRILALSNGDGVHQFFDELEAKKTILSKCTDLFTTLSTHFSSLQHSVTEKSQSFNSLSKETLEFVHLHKTFILKCESSAAAHIEEQREATLALQLTTPISISFFRSGSPSPSRNNVVFYSFFLFAHVNKGTVAVFAHYVCAMVVCWRCDLWFGGVGHCLMVALVRGELAEKRKNDIIFNSKINFLHVIPFGQWVYVTTHVACQYIWLTTWTSDKMLKILRTSFERKIY